MKKYLMMTALATLSLGVSTYAMAGVAIEDPTPQVVDPEPVVVEQVASKFQGAYVGVNAGYVNAKTKINSKLKEIASIDNLKDTFKKGSFTGGVQGGVNFVTNNLLYGVEGDVNYSGIKNKSDCANAPASLGGGVVSCEFKMNYFGTLRPRIGYVFGDSVLAYATGGLTVYNAKFEAKFNEFKADENKFGVGWNVGAGVEAMVTDNISIKGEYLYHRLGGLKIKKGDLINKLSGNTGSFKTDKTQLHTVRLGVNYHF